MIASNPNNDQTSAKWVNVEERLPEENGRYLVTMQEGATNRHVSTRYFRKDGYPTEYWAGTRFQNHRWERRTLGVVAWAPLPKPYGRE